MAPLNVTEWRKLPLSLAELCIDTTLRCGQSFRWRRVDDEWTCVLHGRLLSLKQDSHNLHYRVAWPRSAAAAPKASPSRFSKDVDDTEDLLRHYFSLRHDLTALYDQWSESDANFRKKAPKFAGIRILSQDAWEALIAFICSSNNNISRISQMVHKLCLNYGPLIAHVGDDPFHDFPQPKDLSGKGVETHLRTLGFGYRAKYIAQTARLLCEEKPDGWLNSLTNPENPPWGGCEPTVKPEEPPSYRRAHEELLSLSGVGPKVADCVCLMGLGWGESVPVDTHVWQIAQRDYKFGKTKTKTFSKAMYDAVGDHFRGIWGPQAGWAQSVLFTANLKSFSEQAKAQLEAGAGAKPEGSGLHVKLEVEVEEKVQVAVPPEIQPTQTPTPKKRRVSVVQQVKVEEETPSSRTRASKRRRAQQ